MENPSNMKSFSNMLFMLITIVISIICMNSSRVFAEEKNDGNIKWEIIDKTLYIKPVTGTDGTMKDYVFSWDEQSKPWKKDDYTNVVIETGVTSIGNNAFKFTNIKNVTIANTVTTIGDSAFASNDYLERINIPSSVKSIGDGAFASCNNSAVSLTINFDCVLMPKIGDRVFSISGLYKPVIINVKNSDIKQQLSKLVDDYFHANINITGTTNISTIDISQVVDKEYTGKGIEQSITIKDGSYILQPQKDYKISYCNNINSGTATATITGIGYYTGSISKTFKIKPILDKKEITIYNQSASPLKLLGASSAISWKSADSNIATVDSKGIITGKKAGKTTITATVNGFTATCTVTVIDVTISKSTINMYVGDKQNIDIIGSNGNIAWKTSNTSIASVDAKGVVTGKKSGTAVITAIYNGKAYTCKVTVTIKPIIIITNVDWDTNSADGVEPIIEFKNNSNKVIKYVEFETAYYNAVGDSAYCDIKDTNNAKLRVTGPIQPGASDEYYWNPVIYNGEVSRMDIVTIKVTFMDGTISIINYNRQWHDEKYYKQ